MRDYSKEGIGDLANYPGSPTVKVGDRVAHRSNYHGSSTDRPLVAYYQYGVVTEVGYGGAMTTIKWDDGSENDLHVAWLDLAPPVMTTIEEVDQWLNS